MEFDESDFVEFAPSKFNQIDESDFDDSPVAMPDVPNHGVYVLPSAPKGDVRVWPKAPVHDIAPNYYGEGEYALNKLQYDFIRLKERFLAAKTGTEKMALLAELKKAAAVLQRARDEYDMRKMTERVKKLGGRLRGRRRRTRKRRRARRTRNRKRVTQRHYPALWG